MNSASIYPYIAVSSCLQVFKENKFSNQEYLLSFCKVAISATFLSKFQFRWELYFYFYQRINNILAYICQMFNHLLKYPNLSEFIITLLNFISLCVYLFYVFELEIFYLGLMALLLLFFALQLLFLFCGFLFSREGGKMKIILKISLMILFISISIILLSFILKQLLLYSCMDCSVLPVLIHVMIPCFYFLSLFFY